MKKESIIQKEVISHLSTIPDIFFFSPMNETAMMILKMFKIPDKTCYRIIAFLKKMGMVPGVADIVILYSGIKNKSCGIYQSMTLFIELKTQTGKLSKVQKIIHEKIKSVGHDVEVAYSLDGVKKLLSDYGIVKGDF